MSRVISALNGITLMMTLLITNLLSPLPLQVGLLTLTPFGRTSSNGRLWGF